MKEDKAYELKRTVEKWVNRSFNFIQLEIYEKMADGYLFEYIDPIPLDTESWWYEYDDRDNVIEVYKSYGFADRRTKEGKKEFTEYLETEYYEEIYQFTNERHGNYPMWNTLFEFKDGHDWADWNEIIKEVGCGIIKNLEPFNTTIFMMSCGHSFYSAYWIPMYLRFFPKEGEKYKGVNYSHM